MLLPQSKISLGGSDVHVDLLLDIDCSPELNSHDYYIYLSHVLSTFGQTFLDSPG